MTSEKILLTIPSKPDYISLARLTSSSVASNIGFNIEEIEDIRVSIGEACINVIDRTEEILIEFLVDEDKLTILVKGAKADIDKKDNTKELELGALIIESLMDKVEFNPEGIKMIKYFEDD